MERSNNSPDKHRPGHRTGQEPPRPMTTLDAVKIGVGGFVVTVVGLPLLVVGGNWVWRVSGYNDFAMLAYLLGLYVGINWIVEPFRPPWESSLFPDRVNDWRRARYERKRRDG